MISAADFANDNKHPFGIDHVKTTAKLREIADAIEKAVITMSNDAPTPKFLLQGVTVKSEATREDFTITDVTIRVVERR
jgi:hypothetical protein